MSPKILFLTIMRAVGVISFINAVLFFLEVHPNVRSGAMWEVVKKLGAYDDWYMAGVVFALLVLVVSHLAAPLLPKEESVGVSANPFALLTVALRCVGVTTFLDQTARLIVIQIGWVEKLISVDLVVMMVFGMAVFWYAPQIARWLLKEKGGEPVVHAS